LRGQALEGLERANGQPPSPIFFALFYVRCPAGKRNAKPHGQAWIGVREGSAGGYVLVMDWSELKPCHRFCSHPSSRSALCNSQPSNQYPCLGCNLHDPRTTGRLTTTYTNLPAFRKQPFAMQKGMRRASEDRICPLAHRIEHPERLEVTAAGSRFQSPSYTVPTIPRSLLSKHHVIGENGKETRHI